MTIQQLHRRWLWLTLAAIAAFAVLAFLDLRLKAATGVGTRELQAVATGAGVNDILGHWYAPANAIVAGFNLGFDYLFMPLYGFAFFYSGIIVRERFTPKPGLARRAMQFVAAIPLAGMLADVIENTLETRMLVAGASDEIANLAFTATTAKLLCFYLGLVLLLAAIVARLVKAKA